MPGVPKSHGVPGFRRWLVDKLKQTRWADIPGETRADTARRLWVAPEALAAAQRALDKDRQRLGKHLITLGSRKGLGSQGHQVFEVLMPKSVYADWKAYCQSRRVEPSVVLRSLVISALKRTERPNWLGRRWYYRGQMLPLAHYPQNGKKWPFVARTRIPLGVRQALLRKAEAWGVNISVLMRAEAVELLEGRLHRLPLIMTVRELSDDPDTYLEKTNDGR